MAGCAGTAAIVGDVDAVAGVLGIDVFTVVTPETKDKVMEVIYQHLKQKTKWWTSFIK